MKRGGAFAFAAVLVLLAFAAATRAAAVRLEAVRLAVAERTPGLVPEPFSAGADYTCLECHPNTGAHVKRSVVFTGFDRQRCAVCHVDFRGKHAVTAYSDAPCMLCHADPTTVAPDTTLPRITSFANDHPQFRPSVPVAAQAGGAKRRERMPLDGARSASGLKFSHAEHLGPQPGAPERKTLVCRDCHEPPAGGATVEPVVFEKHCSRCHEIGSPNAGADPVPHRELRMESAEDRRACVSCHVVAERAGNTVAIVPVALAARWLPLSRFSHAEHVATECERCHDARRSSSSDDVLLPGIETCRACHVDTTAQPDGKVASPCLSCHDFHHEEHGTMRPELPSAALDDSILASRWPAQ